MKRIASLLLALLLLVLAVPQTVFASGDCGIAATDLPQGNVSADNVYSRTARQNCFVEPLPDGKIMTVYYVSAQQRVEISYYSPSFKIQKTLSIDTELPIWGGFYSSEDHYYIFTGQENFQESDEVEVIRVTQYTKDWEYVECLGLYDVNIVKPFASGQLRCAMADNVLVVHTAREMYQANDGLNHQANFTFSVDVEDMSLIDYRSGMQPTTGYVSHSFDQYILYDGEKFVTMDHGDAYPRAVVLHEHYPTSFKQPGKIDSQRSVHFFNMPGKSGDNDTGLHTGGFAMNDNCYVMVGNQRWDDLNNPQYRTGGPYNVFVSVIDKTTYRNTRYAVSNLTEKPCVYQWGFVSGKQEYPPYLIKLNDSSFLVMWRVTEEDTFSYQKLDANGKPVGKVYTAKGTLSFVQPQIINGKITWFSNVHNSVTFYTISASDLSQFSSTTVNNGHAYVYKNDSKHHWKSCIHCGNTTMKTEHTIASAFGEDGTYQKRCTACKWVAESDPINVTITEVITDSQTGLKFSVVTKSGVSLSKVVSLSRTSMSLAYVDGKRLPVKVTYKFTNKESGGGSFSRTFYRLPNMTSIEPIATQVYTGKEVKPALKITKDGVTLKSGTDYTVSYTNNVKIGTATVTITGKGNFYGTATKTFVIAKNIAKAKVSGISDKTYNGGYPITQIPKLVLDGKTLVNGVDYTVSHENNRDIGTATIVISGKGAYGGTLKKTFKIKPISVSKCQLSISEKSYTYNGKTKKPSVVVKNDRGIILKNGTHYTVSYSSGCKNVGTYKVTVKMKGIYAGSKTFTFTINPPKTTVKKVAPAKKSLKVSITKKTTQVSGYQVQYATNKSFKSAKSKTVKSAKTTSLTIKSLKAKKTYYVRVRTYKTVNGKKYYSGWSSLKSAKTK